MAGPVLLIQRCRARRRFHIVHRHLRTSFATCDHHHRGRRAHDDDDDDVMIVRRALYEGEDNGGGNGGGDIIGLLGCGGDGGVHSGLLLLLLG
ncbi:hypothetical protein TYRP_006163 [Tyrophagus putrescentiae]|nr:hypothetical protein TYRP_006163 [Tyrophagus putrescentiae]